jgi:hypothetical protein
MNNNPIPESMKSDHLILLVGTNPLPNYVATRLLLKEEGQLYLLYSAETTDIAGRLETALGQKATCARVNESDAGDIAEKMTSLVEGIDGGRIGLHYTGGTKVMSVHAHRAFLEAMKQHHPSQKPVCSYLDARSYEMKFDPQPGQSGFGEKVLLAEKVDLKTVLKLHDINITKKSLDTKLVLPKSARLLAKLHTCRDTAKKWRHWCTCEVRKPELRNSKGDDWLKKQFQLEPFTLYLPKDDVFHELNTQLCMELGLPVNGTIPLRDVKPGQIFNTTYHILKWLDGIWLENYVFDEIETIAEEAGLHHRAMSLDTVYGPNKPNFEFDVGAMKGYQLFGLSCSTTQSKGQAKSKLFEAYIRARQLGGDEARVAVVCPQPGLKKKLEKELPESVQGKVRIFDSAHLENLRDELQDWFEYAK